MSKLSIRIGILALAALAACGETPTVTPVAAPDASPATVDGKKDVDLPVSDVVLMVRTPSAPYGERGGTSQHLDVVLLRKNGMVHHNERHLAWETTDSAVVTVDTAGVVTAQGVGTAAIVAWYKDKAADTASVTVVPVPVASVTLTGVDSMSVDDTANFTAVPLDSAGEALVGRAVAWSSLAPAIAGVSEAGEVVALALGSTEITATGRAEAERRTRLMRHWLAQLGDELGVPLPADR